MAAVMESLKAGRVLEGEQRVLLRAVGWEGYEAILGMVGDGHTRLTYDRGDVELMSASLEHHKYSKIICRFIDTVTEELRIPCQGLRSTTWKRRIKECGLEADDCFYLSNLPRIRGKRGNLNLAIDPPPDLAVEVEISRSALDRMEIYGALGVPEIWRFDGESLVIEELQKDETYAHVSVSPGLGVIAPEEVVRWVRAAEESDDHSEWRKRLREWVKAEVSPRYKN